MDAGVREGAADQHAAVRGEREHVGEHPAVREDLRGVAEGVDERVVEPATTAPARGLAGTLMDGSLLAWPASIATRSCPGRW